jgi:hypothetical protein
MMQPIEAMAVQSASRMLRMLRMVQSVARMLRMVPSVEWMAQSVNHRIRPSGSIRRDVVAADAVVLMTLTEWPACPSSPMPRSWNGPVFQFLAGDAS